MTTDRMTYMEVVHRLKAERAGTVDAVLNTRDHITLDLAEDEDGGLSPVLVFEAPDVEELEGFPHIITPWAHSQIADRTGVPMAYYRRMIADAPGLLRDNLHHWWREEPTNQMVRVVRPVDVYDDGGKVGMNMSQPKVRAWLSDRYRVLDNLDFASTVLATAKETGAMIREAHLDDQRLYLKLMKPEPVEVDAGGETFLLGLIARNSEVGDGSVSVQPVAYRESTGASLIAPDKYKRIHLGGKIDTGVLADDTIAEDNKVVWLKVRDWVNYAFSVKSAETLMEAFQKAVGNKLQVEARKAIHHVITGVGSGDEALAVLEAFMETGDKTQMGVASAIGAAGNKAASYRRKVELEEQAGRLASMDPDEFTSIVDKPATTQQIGRTFGG